MPAEGALRDRLDPGDRLIETFRFEPREGFVRLDLHLARMRRSAELLGFAFDHATADRTLAAHASAEGPQRIRLTLTTSGLFELTATPFQPLPHDAIWRVRIAGTRLDADDRLLAHKTTRRTVYEAARAEFSTEDAQEVLLQNQHGDLCEGTITNLFVRGKDDVLMTPPLACGLLPGILRQELLEKGWVREQRFIPADLNDVDFYVGNSLRGLIPARLAS